MTNSYVFYCAWRLIYVSASNSDWFSGLSVPVVICQSDYFGAGFMLLKESTLISLSHFGISSEL